jgi:CBS domain-containing protein
MLVREVMTPGARWVRPYTPLIEAARVMRDEGIGCLPVGEDDELLGMLTDRDINCRVVAAGLDVRATTVGDAMSRGISYCRDDDLLENAVRVMADKQIHHLPVLGRAHRLVGILSLSDLARRGSLEIQSDIFRLVSRDSDRHIVPPH